MNFSISGALTIRQILMCKFWIPPFNTFVSFFVCVCFLRQYFLFHLIYRHTNRKEFPPHKLHLGLRSGFISKKSQISSALDCSFYRQSLQGRIQYGCYGCFSTRNFWTFQYCRKKLMVLNKNPINSQHPKYQNPKYAPVYSTEGEIKK